MSIQMVPLSALSALKTMARSKRRVISLVLILFFVGMLLWIGRGKPVEVEVRYELPDTSALVAEYGVSGLKRPSVQHLHVSWTHEDGGEVTADFDYDGRRAPVRQSQMLNIPSGRYSLTATFELKTGESHVVRREAEITEDGVVVINLK